MSGLFGGHWSGEMKSGVSRHKSVIVSRHVPCTQMHCLLEYEFVQPGVKVNGDYYREVLLKEKLLPCIKEI